MRMGSFSIVLIAIKFFRALGFDSLAWSLRRLFCPVKKDALVLEVGSGNNPYARANVLLDAYETTEERGWTPLIKDRPIVLGFVENMPFKDNAFDFVIASHVLEHSRDPERFLNELQRVAKAGYIEVPDAFMERINPYTYHRLEITVRGNCLLIKKKKSWIEDPELVELYENAAKPFIARGLIPTHPFAFHVRYFWADKINFTVLNPQDNIALTDTEQNKGNPLDRKIFSIREVLKIFTRLAFSQRRRNKKIRLIDLLRCPVCTNEAMSEGRDVVMCNKCLRSFPVNNGTPDMRIQNIQELI